MSSDSIVETSQLVRQFDAVRAVDGVDLAVRTGSVHCLIGPNGAGKSTLLRLIIGQFRPTSGRVMIGGSDVTRMSMCHRAREGVGIKFQTASVFPRLSVLQNLRLGAGPRGEDGDIQALAVAERMGLAGALTRGANELSHGQLQWLEIGMVLVARPKLLLLDEPVAGLSDKETARTGEMLLELNRSAGTSIIVVDHDMTFVRQIASIVTVMHMGRIFFEGSMDDVTHNVDIARIYLGE